MTHFILDDDAFLKNLDLQTLRKNYEEKTSTKLDNPSPWGIYTSLGWKDTTKRNSQINGLIWLFKHYESDLNFKLPSNLTYKNDYEKVLDKQNRRLKALRALVGACIYITEKNKTGELIGILDSILGINSTNQIDAETRIYCLKEIVEHFGEIKDVKKYGDYDLKGINFAFFPSLLKYARKEVSKSFIDKFPCANIVSLSLAWPVSMVGYSVGSIVGQAISRTTEMQNTQWRITALVGTAIYMIIGPSAGITLLAPTIASKTIANAFGITAAYVMGKTGEYIGLLVGWTAGLPFDLIWKFAKYTAAATFDLAWPKEGELPEKGVSLIDGTCYVSGQPCKFEIKTEEEIEKLEVIAEIKPDSSLNESEIIQELKETLSKRSILKKSFTPEPVTNVTKFEKAHSI